MTRALSAQLYLDGECGVFTLVLDLHDGTFRIQRDRQFGTWPTSVEIKSLLSEIDVDLILLARLGAFLSKRKIDWEPCDGVINWNNSRLMFSNAELLIANPPYFIAEENWQQFLEVPTIAREFLSALRTPPPSVPTPPSTQMESDIELA